MKLALAIVALGAILMNASVAALAASTPAGLPAGAQQLSPCIPGMGEHWGNPKDLPLGPFYGVYEGKIVFTEIMIDQKAFAAGQSWTEQLKPIAGQPSTTLTLSSNHTVILGIRYRTTTYTPISCRMPFTWHIARMADVFRLQNSAPIEIGNESRSLGRRSSRLSNRDRALFSRYRAGAGPAADG